MIEITRDIEEHTSADMTERAKKCFVRRLSINQYVVTPRSRAKNRRLVTFSLRAGNRMFATCEDWNTGDACPANRFGNTCYHCLAALRRAQINASRQFRHTKAA